MNATDQTQRNEYIELMISPVHQQRQRNKSKQETSTTKKPNKTTEHPAKKQQRAKETDKFKIPKTSGLSISKPCAQNEGRHLDKDATKQRTPQQNRKLQDPEKRASLKIKNHQYCPPQKTQHETTKSNGDANRQRTTAGAETANRQAKRRRHKQRQNKQTRQTQTNM